MRPRLDAPRKLNILVTGAGGLIGGELAGRLIDRGHGVVGLVHSRTTLTRNDGSPLPAELLRAPIRHGAAAYVSGDISKPSLGLDEPKRLAEAVDVIVHVAGVTGFDLPDDRYAAANIDGTRNVVALALSARRPPALLHVSTAYVCGRRSGAIREAPADPAGPFTNAYEASKAAAEAVVLGAREQGLKVAIARPSIVVGAWSDGTIGRFDHLYGLMRLVAEGRITVLPAAPDATLDLVPIDHVCEGLADMAEAFERFDGAIAHLSSGQPTSLSAFVELGGDFPHLIPPSFVAPEAFDTAALRPAERRLFERAAALYAAYLERDPRFETETLRALGGRVCPPLGRPYLKRLVDDALERGFVRPAGHRTSG